MTATTKERAADKAAKHAKRAVELAQLARAAEDAETPVEPDDEIVADINAVVGRFPKQSDIGLYRYTKDKQQEFCQKYARMDEFSEEQVQREWGAGLYRLHVRVPDPTTGKYSFVKGGSPTFRIAEKPTPAVIAAPTGPSLDTFAMMQQMMLQSQESHRAMLSVMMSMVTQRPPDQTMELLKAVMPLIAPLLARKETDPFEMATRLAELLKPAGPVASMADQLDALGKMMEVAERMGGGKSDGPAWLEALKTAAPLLTQAMTVPRPALPVAPAATGGPPAPKAIAAPAAPVAANPPVVEAPEPAPDEPHPLLALLDFAMPSMVRAAERDGDPELYADWLIDQVPEDHLDAFGSFVEQTSVLDQLAVRYPASAPHRAWFERVVKAILDGLEPADEPGAAGEPQPDDDENH